MSLNFPQVKSGPENTTTACAAPNLGRREVEQAVLTVMDQGFSLSIRETARRAGISEGRASRVMHRLKVFGVLGVQDGRFFRRRQP